MTRHYLEGMLFALLAILAFVHAQRRQSMPWAFAGALAYALAVTAKEIYVPLVLVVLVIPPVNNLVARVRLASPFIGYRRSIHILEAVYVGSNDGGVRRHEFHVSFRSVTGMIRGIGSFPGILFWVVMEIANPFIFERLGSLIAQESVNYSGVYCVGRCHCCAVGSVDCIPWNFRSGSLSIPILVCCQLCLCTFNSKCCFAGFAEQTYPICHWYSFVSRGYAFQRFSIR